MFMKWNGYLIHKKGENMRVIVQGVDEASVVVEERVVGKIKCGLALLVGFTHEDTVEDIAYCVKKITQLRIFEDDEGKMNRSVQDIQGSILSVSQFTLFANTKKGNRPSFTQAAVPEQAQKLYEQFNEMLVEQGMTVQTGIFGAHMKLQVCNNGPVTILIDSKQR